MIFLAKPEGDLSNSRISEALRLCQASSVDPSEESEVSRWPQDLMVQWGRGGEQRQPFKSM
jgi:hypothetical protein